VCVCLSTTVCKCVSFSSCRRCVSIVKRPWRRGWHSPNREISNGLSIFLTSDGLPVLFDVLLDVKHASSNKSNRIMMCFFTKSTMRNTMAMSDQSSGHLQQVFRRRSPPADGEFRALCWNKLNRPCGTRWRCQIRAPSTCSRCSAGVRHLPMVNFVLCAGIN